MTNRGVRIRGMILIVLGLALALGMAWLIDVIAPAMQPGGSPSGTRFTGTAEEGRLVNTILTSVLVFGVVFGLYGLFMALTGKESRVMRLVALILLLVMLGAALALGWTPPGLSRLF